jgi:hypothetical protein
MEDRAESFAPYAGGRQPACLEVLAPDDDMGAGHRAQLRGTAHACEGQKLSEVDPVGHPCFGIGDVGEPFESRATPRPGQEEPPPAS